MTVRHVYLDTEFIPADPSLRGLISIGLVADDGREYYAVSRRLTARTLAGWRLRRRLRKNQWLMDNVIPHLPKPHGDWNLHMPTSWLFNYRDPDVKSADRIAQGVADFFADTDADETRLWAWYGAQDMCRLHSLWGNDWQAMPEQIPQWFSELEQLRHDVGTPELPVQQAGLHNALADARHNRDIHKFLVDIAEAR